MSKTGDRGQGTGDTGDMGPELDNVVNQLLEAMVTPASSVDLKTSVLRRIRDERDARAGERWSWQWRLAPIAAAAVLVLAAVAVWWRGASQVMPNQLPPSSATLAKGATSEPRTASAEATAVKNLGTPEPRNLGTPEPRNLGTPEPRNSGTSRPRAAIVRDVTPPLPPLEAPAPIEVNDVAAQALGTIERLQVAPLEIPTVDIDRLWPQTSNKESSR